MISLWNRIWPVDSSPLRLFGVLLGALLLAALRVEAQSPVTFQISPLTIDSGGKSHRFEVELALTPAQKTRGLMFRKSMPAGRGMLFDYGAPTEITMWMKNTYLSLDMLFIDGSGRINYIVERTVPMSATLIASDDLARAVLELNGGTTARLGLKRGDLVRHAIFGTAR